MTGSDGGGGSGNPVCDDERLSRFLLFSRWFAREAGRVKPDAFVPHPFIELSVSCTESLPEEQIWQLGGDVARQRSGTTLYGRADLAVRSVRLQGLDVHRDDTPRYHANITGWSDAGKAAQRMKAAELAAASSLVLREA